MVILNGTTDIKLPVQNVNLLYNFWPWVYNFFCRSDAKNYHANYGCEGAYPFSP